MEAPPALAACLQYFQATLAAEIRAAKADGKYFEGVSDLPGQNIQRAGEPQVRAEGPRAEGVCVVLCACLPGTFKAQGA